MAMLFFPQDDKGVEDARRMFEEGCAEAGVPLLFWREVPVDPHDSGRDGTRLHAHHSASLSGPPRRYAGG